MSEVEEFRATILAQQIEAEEAFVHGDPRPRTELWSRRDPVTLFGAIGMSELGEAQPDLYLGCSTILRRE
jgi:hypothetical protein